MSERICNNCKHSEHDHKWYGQDEEIYNGEERWECRYGDCDCIVTWTDHDFIEPTTASEDKEQQ